VFLPLLYLQSHCQVEENGRTAKGSSNSLRTAQLTLSIT